MPWFMRKRTDGGQGKSWAGNGFPEMIWRFPFLIRNALPLDELPKTALVAAAAETQSVHPLLPVAIKWPNDIVNSDKKIAGILSETVIGSQKLVALIIGFGINVNTLEFPAELTEKRLPWRLRRGKRQDIDSLKQALPGKPRSLFPGFLGRRKRVHRNCARAFFANRKEVIFDDFKTRRRAKVLDILGNGTFYWKSEKKEENTPRGKSP